MQVSIAISGRLTTRKNCGSVEQKLNGIGRSPDPFFPSQYKRKKAVWQRETSTVVSFRLHFTHRKVRILQKVLINL